MTCCFVWGCCSTGFCAFLGGNSLGFVLLDWFFMFWLSAGLLFEWLLTLKLYLVGVV